MKATIKMKKKSTHEMRLSEPFYSLTKFGAKTVEFRLYDDKRSKIKVGDSILFILSHHKTALEVIVTKITIAKHFEDLTDDDYLLKELSEIYGTKVLFCRKVRFDFELKEPVNTLTNWASLSELLAEINENENY